MDNETSASVPKVQLLLGTGIWSIDITAGVPEYTHRINTYTVTPVLCEQHELAKTPGCMQGISLCHRKANQSVCSYDIRGRAGAEELAKLGLTVLHVVVYT